MSNTQRMRIRMRKKESQHKLVNRINRHIAIEQMNEFISKSIHLVHWKHLCLCKILFCFKSISYFSLLRIINNEQIGQEFDRERKIKPEKQYLHTF